MTHYQGKDGIGNWGETYFEVRKSRKWVEKDVDGTHQSISSDPVKVGCSVCPHSWLRAY